jgi:heme/copper-type cytochrome/quinol oxidase subunit 3
MLRIVALTLSLVFFSVNIQAECNAPAGLLLSCSSSTTTSTASDASSYDSKFTTSLLIIGLGIGIGLGIAYLIAKAFESKSPYGNIAAGANRFRDFFYGSSLARTQTRNPVGSVADTPWQMLLPEYRW